MHPRWGSSQNSLASRAAARRAVNARLVEALEGKLARDRERLAAALASGEVTTLVAETFARSPRDWTSPDTSPLDDLRAALEGPA